CHAVRWCARREHRSDGNPAATAGAGLPRAIFPHVARGGADAKPSDHPKPEAIVLRALVLRALALTQRGGTRRPREASARSQAASSRKSVSESRLGVMPFNCRTAPALPRW